MRKFKKRNISLFTIGGLIMVIEIYLKCINIILLNWGFMTIIIGFTLFLVDYIYVQMKLSEIIKWNKYLQMKDFQKQWIEFKEWKKNKHKN